MTPPRGKESRKGNEREWPTTRREEDYLEAIFTIQSEKCVARAVDVARLLDVKSPCVTEMFSKLDRKGLLVYRKYEGVTLTTEGMRIGMAVKDRHDSLLIFLKNLDVQEPIASKDACTLEHDLSPETIMQIKRFNEFVDMSGDDIPIWLASFKQLSRQGKLHQV